jgi:2-hydroxy-6-oxonona-2,4-dienedioate hydrolase
MDWKFVDVEGVRTRYREAGEGEPIVLIHGGEFGQGSADAFPIPLVETLAENYRVIAVDRLGSGHTDNPKEDAGYRMSAVVEHIAAFITTLGLTDVTLAGQSRGAYVSARVAKTHAHLVKRLVIINSGSMSVRYPAEPMPSMRTYHVYNELVTGDIREDAKIMSVTHDHITDEWVEARQLATKSPKAAEAKAAMQRQWTEIFVEFEADKADTLKWLIGGGHTKPTLIIWGVGDPTTTARDGMDIFEILQPHIDDLRFHVINRCGHWPHREYPIETATEIKLFLERSPAPVPAGAGASA